MDGPPELDHHSRGEGGGRRRQLRGEGHLQEQGRRRRRPGVQFNRHYLSFQNLAKVMFGALETY